MTTGRINQITILMHSRRQRCQEHNSKGFSNYGIVLRATSTQWSNRPQEWCFRDLQSTRHSIAKYQWKFQRQFSNEGLRSKLTSSRAYARGRSRIYTLVDSHTLFTHNDTIIFCSLREGLTYSLCAQHAETVCHKKEYCVSSIRWINYDRSFTFLFTSIDSVQD